MIIGIGNDIVNINRIQESEEFLHKFKHKILGPSELQELEQADIDNLKLACKLGKYFAAKEAFAKALGCGFRNGIFLKDIEILHDTLGKPYLKVSGEAANKLQKLTPHYHLHISLSDDYPYALATVIIEEI